MSTFIVYTYQFSPIVDDMPSLFSDEINPMVSMENKNDLFGELLSDENLIISYRNSRFRRRVVFNQKAVVVFRLANKRYLRVEENFHSNKIENYPSILVIVDNREDKQRILIEQRIDAFYDAGYVAKILQNSFRNGLKKNRLSMTISKEYHPSEFWDIVSSSKKGIEMIRFAFPYPNLSRIRDRVKTLMSDINSSTNSKNTRMELNSAPGEILAVSKENEVINDLVESSAGTGQDIVIKAKGVKHLQKVGNTMKSVAIDEIEGSFPEIVLERLLETLNNIE